MSKYPEHKHWLLLLGITASLAATAPTHAADSKNKPDLDAEAKQAAQEDADQQADRDKGVIGKYQRKFSGTFAALTDSSQDLGPDVVGSFTTNASDMKPGKTYLVKVADGYKAVLKRLAHFDGKAVQVTGKLRVIDANGDAKYLVVIDVLEASSTPRAKQRGSGL